MHNSLLTLFAPPEGYSGDFGMLCGFTASRDVLDRITRTFSGDGARPRLAAFIHPTPNAVTDVPGLAWMHFKPGLLPFRLLHAKVALLGFKGADGYHLRLVVSTGNWTSEPLTTSIDMFWCGDLPRDKNDDKLVADILAAADLFGWLRGKCDDSLLNTEFDGFRPDFDFAKEIASLKPSGEITRFIDTREETMHEQIFPRLGKGCKEHLVIGSGFFEAGGKNAENGLIERIRNDLRRRKLLKDDATLDLVLNPDNCQGLQEQAETLIKAGWKLRSPKSCHAGHKDARLHAKFMYLGEEAGSGEIGGGKIYIGSGNFTKKGFKSKGASGNLEAGVVLDLDPSLSWRKNAVQKIADLLPGNFDSEIELKDLKKGEDYHEPLLPGPPPAVTFVEWIDGRLTAPRECDAEIQVVGYDGETKTLSCDWPAPAPAFVTLHPSGWNVPVRADGALVVPRRVQPGLEDILAGIGHFPDRQIGAVDESDDDDDQENGAFGTHGSETNATGSDATDHVYPIRQMMRLLTGLTEAQRKLDPRDWPRWCRELGQDLPGLARTDPAMIEPFIKAKSNPLSALKADEFLPKGVVVSLLETGLKRICQAWGLQDAKDLWK